MLRCAAGDRQEGATMITQISYARLYNVGNFENIKFEAVATVEDGNAATAFEEAKSAVHAEMATWVAERTAAEQRKRDAYDRTRQP